MSNPEYAQLCEEWGDEEPPQIAACRDKRDMPATKQPVDLQV